MSENCKNIYVAIIWDEEKQEILTSKKQKQESLWHVWLKIAWNGVKFVVGLNDPFIEINVLALTLTANANV